MSSQGDSLSVHICRTHNAAFLVGFLSGEVSLLLTESSRTVMAQFQQAPKTKKVQFCRKRRHTQVRVAMSRPYLALGNT